MDENEQRKCIAIGAASAMFTKYYLADEKKFDEFLKMIDEKDKDYLLKILMMQK